MIQVQVRLGCFFQASVTQTFQPTDIEGEISVLRTILYHIGLLKCYILSNITCFGPLEELFGS